MKQNSSELYDRFRQILKAFANEKVEYILIGGFAIILHGFPRLTSDIDIFIKPEEDNLNRLKKALQKVFPEDKEIDSISLQDLFDYAVVRFGTKDNFYIDIVARIGEMFTYQDIKFEIHTLSGIPVRIATPESLYKMKKDSIRPEDKRDTQFLQDLLKNKHTGKV